MFSLLGCFLVYDNLNTGINTSTASTLLFFLAFFLIGFFDDLHDIKASKKLLLQILIFCWFLSNFDLSLYQFFSLLTLGLITINGFNFLDGINGLLPLFCFVLFLSLTVGIRSQKTRLSYAARRARARSNAGLRSKNFPWEVG